MEEIPLDSWIAASADNPAVRMVGGKAVARCAQ